MLRLLAGRNRTLGGALLREVGAALQTGEDALRVVVPKQLTLETELALLEGLCLQGSFRLRVLSPERLCGLIFDAAGRPEGTRVDDRGRVMLVSRAMKAIEGELTLYRGAQTRRGFALRAAKQVEVFRQAGMGPDEVRACAGEERGSLRAQTGGRGRHTRRLRKRACRPLRGRRGRTDAGGGKGRGRGVFARGARVVLRL